MERVVPFLELHCTVPSVVHRVHIYIARAELLCMHDFVGIAIFLIVVTCL